MLKVCSESSRKYGWTAIVLWYATPTLKKKGAQSATKITPREGYVFWGDFSWVPTKYYSTYEITSLVATCLITTTDEPVKLYSKT